MVKIYKKYKSYLINSILYYTYKKELTFGTFTFKFRNSKLSPGIKYYLSKHISNYEYGERILVERLIKNNDVVIEAGTSIGILSGLISNIIGKNGKLITLEGDENLSIIAKSINKFNHNILFISGALTFNNEKYVSFDKDGWLGGKISHNNDELKVRAFNLLDLCHKYSANALVIDIEGSEVGFFDIIIPQSINKIIIELHPHIYGEDLLEKLIQFFINQKFCFYNQVESVYSFTREL
jgi:hypothetical protein